jgi:hypothetical protein
MIIIDSFFPPELIDSVISKSNNYCWKFSRSDKNDDVYWTVFVYGSTYSKTKNDTFLENFSNEEVKKCWGFIKSKFHPIITENNLDSCYLNGLTHGIEAHAHVDNKNSDNFVTIICYVCESWNSHWCGETCFYNMDYSENPADEIYYSHEIIKSVLPRYNRIVMFDGKTVHSVRPLSKTFRGLRKTLMFKLKDVSIKDLQYST